MTKLFYLTLFLLMFNFSFSQSDEDFTYSTSDKKGCDYYIYIEKVNYSTTEVWVKRIEPLKTVKNKSGKYVKTGGGYVLQFMIINCSDREYDVRNRISYDRNGNVVESDDYVSYNNKVIPGSVMSGVFDSVCTE